MEIEILGQPYREWASGGSYLATVLQDSRVDRVVIATAWVRESGMRSLVSGLKALRARGGTADMVVGVDLKGTTRQGLEEARRHVDNLYVVHDPEGRTFHPKVYLATGKEFGYALIGSNNLTAGGLAFNYECAFACTFVPHREPEVMKSINAYVQLLVRDRAICKRVTPAVLARLIKEDWLADEGADRRHRNEDRTRSAAARSSGSEEPLFSASAVEKRKRAVPSNPRRPPTRAPDRTRSRVALAPDTWWKRLGVGDAQRPPQGNPTGVVRLTPPHDRSDRGTFFRRVFFADERWRSARDTNGNRIQIASITVDAEIGGHALGPKAVVVDYGKYRDVRGRATTVLHWGELMEELRATDVTDWYLLVERGPGAYRLLLTPTQPA
jgi:hypothetical protein